MLNPSHMIQQWQVLWFTWTTACRDCTDVSCTNFVKDE